MSKNSEVPISDLQINQRSWTIRVKTLRVGFETSYSSNLSSKFRKMIVADEEGTRIGVVIFNNDLRHFDGKFGAHKTYVIANGEVKGVHPKYPNAHPEKELVLKGITTVKDAFEPIADKYDYNFVAFEDIDLERHRDEQIDIFGMVIKVKEYKMTSGALKSVRDITIINEKHMPIVVCLWDDMAKTEGGELQKIADQYPIIAISKVATKQYLGELQLQTTQASVLQIEPTHEEIEHMRKCINTIHNPLQLHELSMKQRIKGAREVTLKEIIHNRDSLIENMYYCFKGIVDKVENTSSLWYNSCKMCSASVFKTEDSVSCKKCFGDEIETVPRYRLILNIIQGDDSACITMFEEAATIYIGCAVDEYITSVKNGENESQYYTKLSLQQSSEFRFLFTLNTKAQVANGKLNIVAEAFEKIEPLLTKEPKRKVSAKRTSSTRVKKTLEATLDDKDTPSSIDKNETDVAKKDGENKKRRIKKKKLQDLDLAHVDKKDTPTSLDNKEKKNTPTSLDKKEPTVALEDGENKKRRITKKKKEDYLDVAILSDDDEETLATLQKKNNASTKIQKKITGRSIKIKQEKK